MILRSSFSNTHRHILVNILYTLSGLAYIFLHICFFTSCMSGHIGFTADWIESEFWHQDLFSEYSPYRCFCLSVSFVWAFVGTPIASYVLCDTLCHFLSILSKTYAAICKIVESVKRLIYLADKVNI